MQNDCNVPDSLKKCSQRDRTGISRDFAHIEVIFCIFRMEKVMNPNIRQ